MRNSNELLSGILVTLTSINNKMEGGGGSSKENRRSSTGAISGSIASIGAMDDKDRRGFTDFAKDISDVAKTAKPKKIDALTKSLKGLFKLLQSVGESRAQSKIHKAINSFSKLGRGLERIADPLNSMAFFLLKLGVSILGFAAALLLTSKMLGGTSPMDGIGMVLGVVTGMVLLMVLLGSMGKVVRDGGKTITIMGVALMALAAGMVIFVGALLIIPMMIGENPDYMGMLKTFGMIGLVVGGMALLFAGIGALDKYVSKGLATIGMLALGMVVLSAAVILVALAARAISAIGAMKGSPEEEDRKIFGIPVSPMVYGFGVLGTVILGAIGLFALMGSLAIPIGLGTGVALGVSLAMIGLALSTMVVVEIAKKLSGEDISGNIADLVGGVFWGLSEGVSRGLLGENADPNSPWWQKAGTAAKSTAKLMAGIALLTGVAAAISLFALSLRAFESVGQIIPIEGYDADGKPIYGKRVTVTKIAKNIADSIGMFFTTLADLFGPEGSARIDKEQMNTVLVTLMGSGGFSLFGVPVLRTGPNMMDALYSFADVLSYWGKFGEKNEIPGGTDANGIPMKPVKVTKVAKNITEALGAFMNGLSSEILKLDEDLAEKSLEVAYILLGKKNTGLLGWLGNITGVTRDRPGILEPVSKFGEIIAQFANGQYIKGYKPDGTPEYGKIDYKKTANNIVEGIKGFTLSLANGLTGMTGGEDYGKHAKNAGAFLENYEGLFESLGKLSNAQSGLDKLAGSLHNVGEGLGVIAGNLNAIDADKFDKMASSAASYRTKTAGTAPLTEREGNAAPGRVGGRSQDNMNWDDISTRIGQEVGDRVSAALESGQFRFSFEGGATSGVFYLEPD